MHSASPSPPCTCQAAGLLGLALESEAGAVDECSQFVWEGGLVLP